MERDVLIAAIDVCDEEWQQNATAHAAGVVGPEALDKLSDGWNTDLCCELSAVADALQGPRGLARHLVEWVIASIAQAHGIPPFIARILGRLVANWLFAPDDLDKTAERLRVLGVLFCVMDGNLDRCPCLAKLGEAVAVDTLKQMLREDLDVSPEPGKPVEPTAEPARFATVTHEDRARDQRPRADQADPEVTGPAAPRRARRPDGPPSRGQEQPTAASPVGAEPAPEAGSRGGGVQGSPGSQPGDERGPEAGPRGGGGQGPPGSQPGDEPDNGAEPGTGWRPAPRPWPGRPPGAGPARASPQDADRRITAACDRVRGARYVPPPATFGAAPDRR